jgi:hypothetical protein
MRRPVGVRVVFVFPIVNLYFNRAASVVILPSAVFDERLSLDPKLWIYDFRTNEHVTLKTNSLKREDLNDVEPSTGIATKSRIVGGVSQSMQVSSEEGFGATKILRDIAHQSGITGVLHSQN